MASTKEEIRRIAEEQKRAWESEGKPLADIAQEREFTADEREKFEKLERAYNSADDRLTALRMQFEQEERDLDFFDQFTKTGAVDERAQISDELRGVLRREKPYMEYVPSKDEVRALSIGTATAGGNTVGKTFLSQLIQPLRQFSAIYAAGAYTLVTENGDQVTVPRLSSFGAAAAQTEATQLTGTDPAFNQVTFGAFKYGDYRGVSSELVQDSLIDIEGLVTQLIGDNISIILGNKFATGAGTTEPTGIATAATVGVTGATGVTGAPSFDNLIDLQESVIAPHQARASWVMSNGAVAACRKLKDTQNRYLWEPNGQTGAPSELLGNPVFRDPFVAAPAVNALSIFYGDFSRYWVRLVGSVRIERSVDALFGSDQVAFRGVIRADGNLVDTNAVKAFKGAAS